MWLIRDGSNTIGFTLQSCFGSLIIHVWEGYLRQFGWPPQAPPPGPLPLTLEECVLWEPVNSSHGPTRHTIKSCDELTVVFDGILTS